MWPIAIVGHLKPGWEDAGTIATRLGQFFASLAEVDPMFSRWKRTGSRRHCSRVPALITMPPERTELRTWIEEGAIFESRDGRKKMAGYSIQTLTPGQNPVRANFWLSYTPEDWWFGHRIGITMFSGAGSPTEFDDPNKHAALIALLRHTLLVTATAWDCNWAGVSPGDYRQDGQPRETVLVEYASGWMIYLDAARAAQITPPQDIAVEKLADGALLLTAATAAIFNGRNPKHWDAALRIQAALAPLNKRKN